ncbi:MAG: hypothetical protein A3F54_03755 [Candidatus Kerfeldbacteria bacterium RIFCSPHIGHO2_12_FULL_48_17]|uniref:Carbohydrate kinase PfkB domain-containing protein n=1 Tax=Candidatus Kerfeldbacteria bacterium RIFCSPHIGHO2_12_FULL_48_17 TaxID=1798542 RepID=A0A1G2AZB8_9BACT|nr:MAG: hypothetical protein A3F54_03755 [Candidatus Kerfeldbacteria bacterium RIFCSPHIGHO2_12_FULL_48_17]
MKKTKFDCVNIGGAVRDITLYTDEGFMLNQHIGGRTRQLFGFPYGGKTSIRNQDGHFTLGGGAANTAVVMSKLGLKTAVLSSLGGDLTGQDIRNDMHRQGVDTSLMQIHKIARSGFSLIVANKRDHDHIIFTYRGATQYLTLHQLDLEKISTAWFYITSLAGSHVHWKKNLQAIFGAARKKKIKVAWNVGGEQVHSGKEGIGRFVKFTDILAVNTSEARTLVGSVSVQKTQKIAQLKDDALFRYLADELHSWGAKIIVITNGAQGAYTFDGSNFLFRGATAKKALDTTGAGDGFNASFLTGQIKFPVLPAEQRLAVSLELGRVNTDSLIRKFGAQEGLLHWPGALSRLRADLKKLVTEYDDQKI